jgi:hypothetical protein
MTKNEVLETSILKSLDSLGSPSSNFVDRPSLVGGQIAENLLNRRDGMMSIFFELGANALRKYNHLNPTERGEIASTYRQLVRALRPAIFQEEAHHKVDLAVFLDAIRDAFVLGALAGDATIAKRMDALSKQYERNTMTASANAERRKPGEKIQAIIENHTYALWEKKSSFRGNRARTAREIRKSVMLEIEATMTELTTKNELKWPKGWEPAEEKTEIGRIRKRIPLALPADE